MRTPPDLPPPLSSPVGPTSKSKRRQTSQNLPATAPPSPTSLPALEAIIDHPEDVYGGGDDDDDDELDALARSLHTMNIQHAAYHYEQPTQYIATPHNGAAPTSNYFRPPTPPESFHTRPPPPEYQANGIPPLLSRWIRGNRTGKLHVVSKGFRTGIFPTW